MEGRSNGKGEGFWGRGSKKWKEREKKDISRDIIQ
jgi:hypothetical protein